MARPNDATTSSNRRARQSMGAPFENHKAMDKENTASDMASTLAAARKKSRSKSLGPGYLDALKQASGNRRASLAAPIKAPRSILKPSVTALPALPSSKQRSSKSIDSVSDGTINSVESAEHGDTQGSKVAVRTEEEQQAAAREREEQERREARRKSLINRRVSFAAEATLHTFHDIEYVQDSTSSTEYSRRLSSSRSSPHHSATTQGQNQGENPAEIERNQYYSHKNSRRRSSGLQTVNPQNPDDDTATSIIYSSDSEPVDAVEEIADEEVEGESSSDSDDGTLISIDTEEVTSTSVGSDRSFESSEDSSTLDQALRLAAARAGTQNQDMDEREKEDDQDEAAAEEQDEEVIPSFGWIKKGKQLSLPTQATESSLVMPSDQTGQEQGNRGAVRGSCATEPAPVSIDSDEPNPDEDMSMDVTVAFGGILPSNTGQQPDSPRRINRAETGEATMDLTTAFGVIIDETRNTDGNEDISMEMTAVMGGLLFQEKSNSAGGSRRLTVNSKPENVQDDVTMDMTTAVGRILPPKRGESDVISDGDITEAMDITDTIGGIIEQRDSARRSLGKKIMEEEADKGNSPGTALKAVVERNSPSRIPSSRTAIIDGDTGLGLSAFRGNGLGRSTGPPTGGQKSLANCSTGTETQLRAGQSTRGSRSSLGKRKSTSRSTPERKTTAETRTPSPNKPVSGKQPIFCNDPKTGNRNPTFVLTPQQRKLTGVGVDRNGIGSPKVAALCDRRGSIGDEASVFVPGKRSVAFEDPREMSAEFDQEHEDEVNKEKIRRSSLGLNDRDGAGNLREMIDSMSPKRKPWHGRKSLHVGSASGILGKRPAELDEDEEEEEIDGIKRLKGHQSSPVRNVRLRQPPSKEEMTGLFAQSGQRVGTSMSSPLKEQAVASPGRKMNAITLKDNLTVHHAGLQISSNDAQLKQEEDAGPIQLQDFLNMTSIRFMELNTTKRRHTTAPGGLQDGNVAAEQEDLSLERCITAACCTVPKLELYQHSCRELKKYISEGRRMVREIEAETAEENPPLFREYVSATPDVKALMDHQFKNVKTHARLLSKAMWYEWRMQLQDGLKKGLVKIREGMHEDDKVLKKQQELLSSVLPGVTSKFDALTEECRNLEEAARELADCDPTELATAREELTMVTEDINSKKQLIAELRQQLEESEKEADGLNARKKESLAALRESERIREECRGWTSTEVGLLKDRVESIEKQYGWAVTGVSGTNLSMSYKGEIELVFDIASFQPHQRKSRIDLWYIADHRDVNLVPKTTEKDFILQCIRDHLRALPQDDTRVSRMLDLVRAGWDKSRELSAQLDHVKLTFPTTVCRTSDASVAVTSSLLLVPLKTRVEVVLHLHRCASEDGIGVAVAPAANVVYGEPFNTTKMSEFLSTRISKAVGSSGEWWSDVMVELHSKLIARGRKAAHAVS